ncbi:putative mechanosensitive ion channel protein [Candidatus Sulfopaludibacter sp. SbA3]|nr:putative mechanosensitive ion channel protein [Candidatus Sulfopaludibacter sp. SbA3]
MVLLLTFCWCSLAQTDPLHRETPRSSVSSFLEACHAGNYGQAWRYIDLRNAPADQRSKVGPHLAQQLAQVLDRDGRFDVASLSGSAEGDRKDGLAPDRDRIDSFRLDNQEVGLDLERITLHSGLTVWLFSSGCIDLIPTLAKLASDSPIERHLPQPLVDWRLMDTALWRWIALIALAVALGPLSRLVVGPILACAGWVARRIAPHLNHSSLQIFVGPLRLLLCVAAFRAGMEWVGPGAILRLYLERLVALLFFIALARLCMAIVDVAIRRLRVVLQSNHQSFSYSALPLTSRVLKITIALLMIAAILSSWGYNTTTILAGLGVGGLAIALAAQKTIENLFGGVAVITDQPVGVGDFCRFGDLVGTVEDVGLRSTRIRTLNRTVVTVPNGEFSAMTLENFSKRDKMWFHITLNLRRDTLPSQVRELLQEITQTLKGHPKLETGSLPVRFIGVGTYSLDLEVFAYVLTADYDEFLQIQQDLLLWILDAVQEAGTALAVPTQAYLSLNAIPANTKARIPAVSER